MVLVHIVKHPADARAAVVLFGCIGSSSSSQAAAPVGDPHEQTPTPNLLPLETIPEEFSATPASAASQGLPTSGVSTGNTSSAFGGMISSAFGGMPPLLASLLAAHCSFHIIRLLRLFLWVR